MWMEVMEATSALSSFTSISSFHRDGAAVIVSFFSIDREI